MACINPDGTLTEVAKRSLTLLAVPYTAAGLAEAAGLPLWRVRATLRETGRAKLVACLDPDAADPSWRLTELGVEALELSQD
ncbi:hypothetical protein [Inquilinus sp. CA228]|uniref:hypothetical protein n=1 Tax=Inquilinus sp. CA228 TaxID=3455609 RepID=UPI003F8D0BD7